MKKLYYSYQDFQHDTHQLIQKIPKDYDAIIAITRGGLTLSQAIAESLDIRNVQSIQTQLYDGTHKRNTITILDNTNLKGIKKTLVVDDIADSGETLQAVMQHLKTKYLHVTFESATLFYKTTSTFEPTYWVQEATCWIEFFWEIDFKL